MSILKSGIKKLFSALGYDLYRSSENRVHFENFSNLAQGYEQHLNECSGETIPENETRIKLIANSIGTPPSEAYYIVQALTKCRDVSGDVCEFGVAQGQTSSLIANEIRSGDKVLHLFDSFEGLPEPTEKDQLKDDIFLLGSMDAYAGTMSCPEHMVQTRLESISFPPNRTVIHKGFVDDSSLGANSDLPTKVSFAYVDFDFYDPIKAVLKFLHRTASTGAVIIVDDYDFFSTGAKTAVDEFLEEQNSSSIVYDFVVPDSRYGHFAVITKVG